MNIKENIGNILGYITQEKHDFMLRDQEATLLSLVESRERQISKLREELQACKEQNEECDRLRQTIQSLTAKLQTLRQEEASRQSSAKDQPVVASEEMMVSLISFIPYLDLLKANRELSLAEGLRLLKSNYEEVLMACGITTVKEYAGRFNASCQKVVGNKKTDDSSLDNYVAEVVRPGYFIGDKCIQPMEVTVYSKKK